VAAYLIVIVVVGVPLAALLLYGRRGSRNNSPTAAVGKSGRLQVLPMRNDFDFKVGSFEKHLVMFHWGQWLGLATIKVDGVEVDHERHIYGTSLTRNYEVAVGASEPHAVRIEKTRKRFLAGYRRQTFKVFVDGELVGEH
jgi:hypothetical protein